MSCDYDVAVVGGGLVGATFAGAMAGSGLAIAVIEPRSPPHLSGGTDARVFAITRASENIFRSLGLWEQIYTLGAQPFSRMRVWDAAGNGEIGFDCADIGESWIGCIIEQRNMLLPLRDRLEQHSDITLLAGDEVESLQRTDECTVLSLRSGKTCRAKLVVAADGARSRIRSLAGLHAEVRPYGQHALVANVRTERPHEETAWQRFLPGGPLAFLPMSNGECSIVWSLPDVEAERIQGLDDARFRFELARAFEYRLGEVTASTTPVAWPLQRLHAPNYVDERIALIGDAAHGIHPLAGQGVNLGLLDAAVLAEVVGDAARAGRDYAAKSRLRRFERWRKGDNLVVQGAMDGFHRLFGATSPWVSRVRNLGLDLVDRAGPVKGRIMRQAMGLSGELPASARQPT